MSDLSQLSPPGGAFAGIRPPDGPPMPQNAQRAPAQQPVAQPPKAKRKKPVKPIALCVLLLLVGYVAKGKIMKPHYAPGQKVPLGQIFDLGTVTANLADGHLAQVGVSLQMTIVGSTKTLTKDTSELTGAVVQQLGEETYSSLLPPSGRAGFQAALLKAFQSDLGTSEGAQQVASIYFTSFVLQ